MNLYYLRFILLLIITTLILSSCSIVKTDSCREKIRSNHLEGAKWNVELNQPIIDKCTNYHTLSILSPVKPDSIPLRNGLSNIFIIAEKCNDSEQYTYEIPYTMVKRVTSISSPLSSAKPWDVVEPEICCCRDREGVLFFDKIEIRAFSAFRGEQNPLYYPQSDGSLKKYEPSFFGWQQGGSNVIFGFDAALLFSVEKTDKFQLGLMSGFWPVNGLYYIPAGVHFRYTINQHPNKYDVLTDSWYLFGDLGIPLDFHTSTDMLEDRYFFDLGIGIDWAITCWSDFSIDIGLRQFRGPLPDIECCPESNNKNPFKTSTMIFTRVGFTF